MTSDRREKRRFEVSLDAAWDGSRGSYNARVMDLSETGCYVDSINETLNGEVIYFKINLPDGDWLELNGEVVHSFTTVGFGVRFGELTSEQSAKLNALLEYLEESNAKTSDIGI